MAENFYTIITAVGKAKIANAQVLGKKVDMSHIAVGDGVGNPTESQTALKNEVWGGNISSIDIDPQNPSWIVMDAIIPSDVGGFTVREVGVFDSAGDLIAIGKYPETYKPVLAEGSAKDLFLRMIIEVSNASSVTLKIDPTMTIASRKYVDDKFSQSVGPINQAVQEIKDGTMTILPLQTEDKTLAGGINEVKTGLDEHKADYEYQTPSIVGTQIRLTKQSDTDRLFFKLGADLTGDITISTDNGATSKPLVDVDGTPITQLEKGFAEVVASASFFTLRSRGISGADKQALIEIVNEAERNESDLKALFIDSVNDKTGSSLPSNAPWIDVQNALTGMTNKKWASGTRVLSQDERTSREFTLGGLAFKPKIVVVTGKDQTASIISGSVDGTIDNLFRYSTYIIEPIITWGLDSVTFSYGGTSFYFVTGEYKWIAFE